MTGHRDVLTCRVTENKYSTSKEEDGIESNEQDSEEAKMKTKAEEEKRARHQDSTVNTADYCYDSDNVDSSSMFRPVDTCGPAQPV